MGWRSRGASRSRQGAAGALEKRMAGRSAGIVVCRLRGGGMEVLLVHPGGPFWKNRDLGAWSIPKGEHAPGEDAEAAARREFAEETGWALDGALAPLGEVRQKGGKVVTAFAALGDFDPASLESNAFELEWPPGSGRLRRFAEVDRAEWFGLGEARRKILPAQAVFMDRVAAAFAGAEGRG